jgi:adenylylsulfate kinase-like enzyme
MTAALTGGPPPLLLPPGFARAAAGLPDKELRRLDDALARLHAVNSRLWQTEDRVRTVGLSADRVADFKREIDQLNAERNVLAERADEVLGVLTGAAPAETPLHTETLASVLDRLSVLTLRIWHSEQATDRDDLAKRRVPALHRQREDLHAALDSLTADVIAGARRLPAPARYKLYGADDVASSEVTPSPRLAQVIAFGGLSECGKSTSAEFVRRICGAQRFKIGYLLRQSAARHGLADPYALSPRRQAELLLDELNRFADAHVDIRLVTIESVHDEASIAELKKLMGDRLQTVYLDAPFAVRVWRSGMAAHAVAAKDEVKMSRGAHQVAALADHLIDNSGSIVELRARLRRIVAPPVPARPRTRSPYGLGLPGPVAAATSDLVDSLRSYAPAVRLVALTGSPGQGTWMAGWSDLDLLVVADHTGAAPVARALRAYQRDLDSAATVGLTLATPHELFAGRLTPRLAFVLHQLQSDGPVLYADPQLELPHITTDDLALAAVHELPQVMLTLRRLRANATPDLLRPLYRHLVLASRLLLREHGVWEAGPDQILAAATRLPGLPVVPVPTLAETVAAWREGTRDQALARTLPAIDALLEWYAAQLAA